MSIVYPKSRDEWLALRHKYVSSTESAALLGMSPYITAFELAVAKKAPAPTPNESTERIDGGARIVWGARLEDAVAKGIAEDYGVSVRRMSGYATDDEFRMGSSFDYEVIGLKEDFVGKGDLRDLYRQHGTGVLEIKNVDALVFRNEWKESSETSIGYEVPEHIEIQVQHQLHCIGRRWAAIGVLVGGNRAEVVIRLRDEQVGKYIQAKVAKFWKELESGIMPPVELPRDAGIIKALYSYAEPGKVLDFAGAVQNEALEQMAVQVAALTSQKSAIDKQVKTLQAKILEMIGDAEKVLFPTASISAGMVAPTRIEAYDRAGYRLLRVYLKKAKGDKDV